MKTHYDVLDVGKNCTSQEIKDAFIRLSKKYHPDRNRDSNAHSKFVQVNEAYSVLGKEDSRRQYDKRLQYGYYGAARSTQSYGGYSDMKTNQYSYDYSHWERARTSHMANNNIILKPKYFPLIICCIVMAIGTGFQLSVTMKKKRDYQSRLTGLMLAHARRRHENFSNELRVKEMREGLYRGMSIADAKAQFELERANRHK